MWRVVFGAIARRRRTAVRKSGEDVIDVSGSSLCDVRFPLERA